jgi:hypothetical protein
LDLVGLSADVSTTLESNLVAVNRILAAYQIKKFEDCEQIMDTDLQQILDILDTLVFRIADADRSGVSAGAGLGGKPTD